jgi:nicotinamidase-related amidase
VVIAGTVTYACVLHTAFDANVRDFDVIVSTDGSATWKADLQEPALKIVELILGQTASIGELIEALAIADATRIEEVIR